MKFTFDNLTRVYSGRGQIGTITWQIPRVCRWMMLMILAFALAACSRPQQQSSSGGGGGASASGTSTGTPIVTPTGATTTPTPSKNAGGAVLNLERWAYFFGGDDEQHETGTIQLTFSETTEGHLVVEGTGKTVWTEVSKVPNCSYKVKTESAVAVYGIYNTEECKFDFIIHSRLPPSATSYDNTGTCDGTIVFNNPESSERIELYKPYSRTNEITGDWWQVSTVKITDINSSIVTGCLAFTPVVIPKSTATAE